MDTAVLEILKEVRSSQAILLKDHRDLQRRLTEWMAQGQIKCGAHPHIATLSTSCSSQRVANIPSLHTFVHQTNPVPAVSDRPRPKSVACKSVSSTVLSIGACTRSSFASDQTGQASDPQAPANLRPTFSNPSSIASAKSDRQRPSLRETHNIASSNGVSNPAFSDALTPVISMISSENWQTRRARKPVVSQQDVSPGQLKLQRFVRSTPFDSLCAFIIVLNAICAGLEVDHNSRHSRSLDFFKATPYFFFVAFTIELFTRLIAFKCSFFSGRDAFWNWFDFLMALISALELLESLLYESSSESDLTRMLGVMKVIRLFRIFRVMRFSIQMRMMLFLIAQALKSMAALICLLFSFLYLFSVVFTMAATDYVGVPGSNSHRPHQRYANEVQQYFGTVPKSMFTCWKSMSGGVSWGEVADPLLDMDSGWFYCIVFLIFIIFSVLCFMNIVTGVFVDGSMEKAKTDREMIVERHLSKKKAYIENMRQVFQGGDDDGSGAISKEEFYEYLADENVQAYFDALNVDTSDVGELFKMLDKDNNGEIEVDEFVDNLVHLMGARAPEQYLQKMMNENRAGMRNLLQILQYMYNTMLVIDASVKKMPDECRQCTDDLELALRSMLPSYTPRPELSKKCKAVSTKVYTPKAPGRSGSQ